MSNLSGDRRRVTRDVDFDVIRYSIDDDSIRRFVAKLNSSRDGIEASIEGPLKRLHQQDYQGVRVFLSLEDEVRSKLRLKLDIGVHTYLGIAQQRLAFAFDESGESVTLTANPPEQVFAEKVLSLSRLGTISTRYKDIYDLYYLIREKLVSVEKVREIILLFLSTSPRHPHDMYELASSVEDALNDSTFSASAARPASKWVDVDFDEVRNTIVEFVNRL